MINFYFHLAASQGKRPKPYLKLFKIIVSFHLPTGILKFCKGTIFFVTKSKKVGLGVWLFVDFSKKTIHLFKKSCIFVP